MLAGPEFVIRHGNFKLKSDFQSVQADFNSKGMMYIYQ